MTDLRIRANQELADLGPPPANPREHESGVRNAAVPVFLPAALADQDAELLRRTATGEWEAPAARDLLIDAPQECR